MTFTEALIEEAALGWFQELELCWCDHGLDSHPGDRRRGGSRSGRLWCWVGRLREALLAGSTSTIPIDARKGSPLRKAVRTWPPVAGLQQQRRHRMCVRAYGGE